MAQFLQAQTEFENLEVQWLEEVMPRAVFFSAKTGNPPVIRAYSSLDTQDASTLLGYIFTTPDLPPEEIGFSGPLDLLVGLDLRGNITGVKVLHYFESYVNFRGDFVNDSNFPEKFVARNIGEEFRIGQDIDGIARATITSWAMARGLRNAARRVAEAYIPGSSYAVEASAELSVLQTLREQTWLDLVANGYVQKLSVPIADEADLEISIAYMGHYRLGEILIGAADYSNLDRTASQLVEDGHILLLGLNGNAVRLRQLRLGVIQNGNVYPNRRDRVIFAGTANAGKIAGQAQHAVALFIDQNVDITQPFELVYDTSARTGDFTNYVSANYKVPEEILSLVSGALAIQTEADPDPGTSAGWLALLAILLAMISVMTIHLIRHAKSRTQ